MRTTATPSWAWISAFAGLGAVTLGLVGASGQHAPARPYAAWRDYGGSPDSMQYSALRQVDASNVGRLQQAWWLAAPGPSGRFSFGPLIVDDVMYVVGKDNAVLALEASTGK